MIELILQAQKAIDEDDMKAYEAIREEVRKEYKRLEGLQCQN